MRADSASARQREEGEFLHRDVPGVIGLALMGAGRLGVSLALPPLISSLLFGISAFDPAAFLGMTMLQCAVALLAGYLPARRASKTDPMLALRAE